MSADTHDESFLFKAVRKVAISPEDAKRIVENYFHQAHEARPESSPEDVRAWVADKIIKRYAHLAGIVGGTTALAGVVPGLGTAISTTLGAGADATTCMKLQVDMCMCLVAAFGYDLSEADARHLAFLIAAGGALEKAGTGLGTKLATKAGVRLLREYLKGAALQAVKQMFKKVGIIFTRKALEKSLPFGIGVVIGTGANYGMTRFVGAQAKAWLVLDAQIPR